MTIKPESIASSLAQIEAIDSPKERCELAIENNKKYRAMLVEFLLKQRSQLVEVINRYGEH